MSILLLRPFGNYGGQADFPTAAGAAGEFKKNTSSYAKATEDKHKEKSR